MINGNQLFALACALSLGVSSTAFAADAGDAKKGQDAFMRYHCYVCHGTEGNGGPGNYPKLAPSPLPIEGIKAELRTPRAAMPRYTDRKSTRLNSSHT